MSIGALGCLWLALVVFGWARWGSVTVDCGRELYVAAALAEGKMLYRDVWYMYGPGAPILKQFAISDLRNSRQYVAYLAGSLAGLATVLILFRCALYVAPLPAAFAVGYIVLIQSFGAGIFNYPLPYTYASVYGIHGSVLVSAVCDPGCAQPDEVQPTFCRTMVSGGAADEARVRIGLFRLLGRTAGRSHLNSDHGSGVWQSTGCHTGAVNLRSGDRVDGVDRRSAAFITQENFMSWPTSYFMQTYGQYWLRTQRVRFIIVPDTESHNINCRLRGFLGRSSFLASVGLSQTTASCRLYRRHYRARDGCVLCGNT